MRRPGESLTPKQIFGGRRSVERRLNSEVLRMLFELGRVDHNGKSCSYAFNSLRPPLIRELMGERVDDPELEHVRAIVKAPVSHGALELLDEVARFPVGAEFTKDDLRTEMSADKRNPVLRVLEFIGVCEVVGERGHGKAHARSCTGCWAARALGAACPSPGSWVCRLMRPDS
jgi:hypothetical protein